MVEFPDEIENKEYINKYKQNFNNNPVVKDNNLLLVSNSINQMKNIILGGLAIFLLISLVYVYLVAQGYEKANLYNQNNFSIINQNNFSIINNVNVSYYPSTYVNTDNYFNINFTEDSFLNET